MAAGLRAEAMDGTALARLVERVAATQDRAAFGALFDHFAPRVRGFLIRRGLPQAQADELAQETLLAIWRRAGSYDVAKSAVSTWVYTIARNLHIDQYRKLVRAGRVDLTDPSLRPGEAPAADELYARGQDVSAVTEALATLPNDQRRVLELAFMEGLSHSEIALKIALPLGTVKSRIRLAMDKLKLGLGGLQ
ncbi:sigma-70 family RNA polymerase sigma factor [uncultured Maricaulis sp.]|uniref:sigma-70 family RNA polymerase sigma factor n=1 Tax=uncultured Maricaulis sp. TaxID=174710 RepID=UPI0030D87A8E|tara:strand:+ start:44653 stop:45231 length:579 start_codon:yes stop_codon:yes gene_type:complete